MYITFNSSVESSFFAPKYGKAIFRAQASESESVNQRFSPDMTIDISGTYELPSNIDKRSSEVGENRNCIFHIYIVHMMGRRCRKMFVRMRFASFRFFFLHYADLG